MSNTKPTPFRFFDLPSELRLTIYDYLTIVISARTNESHGLTVVTRHIPGVALLSTCRQAYDEAMALRERVAILKDTPLRFLVNSVSGGYTLLRDLLVCASTSLHACICPHDMASVCDYFLAKDGGLFGDGTMRTHAQIHRLIGHRSSTVPQRTVEVAVEFTDLPRSPAAHSLVLRYMTEVAQPSNWNPSLSIRLRVVLRPVPLSDVVRRQLKGALWALDSIVHRS